VVVLLCQWDKLVLYNDVLYRNVQIDGNNVRQQIVPKWCSSRVHDDMGHVGRDMTEDLLITRF